MKKYRTFAAATLIVLPSMFFSGSSYSTSDLPAIGESASRSGQQSCPLENGSGCAGPNGLFGANPVIAAIFGRADQFRRARIDTCLQFMQQIRQLGARSG